MLIREQGRLIKLLRVEPPRRPSIRGGARECVIGTFRADEPVPTGLIDTLSRDERKLLERWLEAYRESKARNQVRPVLASAPEQLKRLVGALEVAADTGCAGNGLSEQSTVLAATSCDHAIQAGPGRPADRSAVQRGVLPD